MARRPKPLKPLGPFVRNDGSPQSAALIGWWPGAGAGATLWDASAALNHGALTNFAAPFTRLSGWTDGLDGGRGAIVFDGSDDGVQFTAAQSAKAFYFRETKAFSVSFWMRPGTEVGTVGFLVGVRAAPVLPDGAGWFSYHDKATSAVYWIFQGANNVGHQRLSTASSVPVGALTHITFTRDSTNTMAGTKIYINGKIDAGTPTDTGTPDNPAYSTDLLGIGRNPQLSNLPYLGTIEDVKVWSRCLTAAEAFDYYVARWDLRYQPGRKATIFAIAAVTLPKVLRRRMGS